MIEYTYIDNVIPNRGIKMEKILDKVKKLLALANNSAATDGERDNALRMAHGLLAKHNLSMEDAQEHEAMEGREKQYIETFHMTWAKHVCNNIAKLFFCSYYVGQKLNATKGKHYFVGKQSNAITATLISTYVINSILKECRNNWKHNLAPESRSFCIGAADRLRERVAEMIKDANVAGGTEGTSIILHNLYKSEADANKLFLENSGTSLVNVKSRDTKVNSAHYDAGQQFGDRINLNGQIANKDQLRLK